MSPAVWPAVRNLHMNVLFYYIDKKTFKYFGRNSGHSFTPSFVLLQMSNRFIIPPYLLHFILFHIIFNYLIHFILLHRIFTYIHFIISAYLIHFIVSISLQLMNTLFKHSVNREGDSLSAFKYVFNTTGWQLADKRNQTGDMAQIWSCVRR